ncbi:Uncharacterised protein [Vibrio cholerae]|nr:Uncharacterised protein [Vibrio cholerae]CSC39306.1 Uncharacterised protein [Vibrio cholerae]
MCFLQQKAKGFGLSTIKPFAERHQDHHRNHPPANRGDRQYAFQAMSEQSLPRLL